MENWTKVYGERGIVLRGTISDPAYDVMVGTNVISTTNGNWQIKITPPEGGMFPFSVKPKMGMQSTSASGVEFIDVGMTSYCYSEVMSYNYYATGKTNTLMSSFLGWDEHNSLWYRRLNGRSDCTILYKGMGEHLLLDSESDCASPPYRALYPNTYMGNYFDGVIGCNVNSSLKLNLGGNPNDTTKYRVVVDLVLYGIFRKDEDETWLTESPITNDGWRVAGNSLPWVFEAYSGLQMDATPTPPPFYNGWAYYDISINKTPIN
jgi:hypothetical protein